MFTAYLFAQTEQKSIELPDFVITGKQTVDIQAAKKKKPELINMLSQGFFTPQYSPDDLPMLISSAPVPVKPGITANDYYNGRVKIGIGNNTFPTGTFHLSKAFGNYLVSADAWGTNIKEYIANSDFNTSGVSLNNVVFVSTKSDFLPGTQIKLNGGFSRDAYKFFASFNPTLERKTNKGFGVFSISNNYNRWVNFTADFGVDYLSLDDLGIEERLIKNNLLLDVKLNGLIIGGTGSFNRQIIDNNSGTGNEDFYTAEGYVNLSFPKSIFFKGGIYYAEYSNTSFFTPFASVQLLLDKGLTVFVQYKPHVNNNMIADMLGKNMYVNPRFTFNISSKVKSELTGTLKYEYDKFFSVGITGSYSKVDNYLYFEDVAQTGKFNPLSVPDVDDFFIRLDLLFHPAQFSYFHGEVKYQEVKENSGKYVPYQPRYSSKLIYGYDFNFGLGVKAGYQFAYDIFTDVDNINKLENYQNLSFGISYKLWENLSLTADFQNILNKSNFVWKGYEEKPFDILVGAEYRW